MTRNKTGHRPVVERAQADVGIEIARRGVEIEEQKTVPLAARHALQPMRGPVEVIRGNGMTGCNQRTVRSRECESMIGATNELAERLALGAAEFSPTVRAGVVERGNRPVDGARNDHGRRAHLHPLHLARGEISHPAHHHPLPRKHRRHLAREPGGILIGLTREAFRAARKAWRKRVALESHYILPGMLQLSSIGRTKTGCHLTG